MAKGKKKIAALAQKRARKAATMGKPGEESKYAKKHQEQMRGKFRPTSPFYDPSVHS